MRLQRCRRPPAPRPSGAARAAHPEASVLNGLFFGFFGFLDGFHRCLGTCFWFVWFFWLPCKGQAHMIWTDPAHALPDLKGGAVTVRPPRCPFVVVYVLIRQAGKEESRSTACPLHGNQKNQTNQTHVPRHL